MLHNPVNPAKAPYSDSAELYSTVHTTEQNQELRKELTGRKSGLNRNLMDGLGEWVAHGTQNHKQSQLTSHETGQPFLEQTDA